MDSLKKNFKAGMVGIIGMPNVGKSTMLNMLIGEKISIISDKAQTTRGNIKGIYNDVDTQIVFIDTPGIQNPRNKLGNYMLKQSKSIIKGSDICLFLVDAGRNSNKNENEFIEYFKKINKPKILVINKIDLISNEKILLLIDKYSKLNCFDEIVPISAKKGSNKNELLESIKRYLPKDIRYFPENMVTDQSNTDLISEIIREKLLKYLDKEIPHGVAVEIEKINDDIEKNLIQISAIIYCEKESHKKIIIGKNGKKLKGIGKSARTELEEIYGCKIFLSTWVKVKSNWRNNNFNLKELGFDLKKKNI